MLDRFDPEVSHYHWVMEKKYGREKAMQILGLSGNKRPPKKQKLCKMCNQPFESRSRGKIYCGEMVKKSTCSYKAKLIREKNLREKRKRLGTSYTPRLQKIYKRYTWLKKPELV